LTIRPVSVARPRHGAAALWRRLCVLLLIAAQLLAPLARAQLPGMGDGAEMAVGDERALGDSIAAQLYRDPDYLDDPVIMEYVQDIWQHLLAAARKRGELTPEIDERFAWQILLNRDPTINAFALPGGYMGINLGLIGAVGSRDEMATVMGHELSHITQRHIARMLARQKKQLPWILAGMILGALAAAKSNSGDAGQALLLGTQAYAMQSQLSFSRDMEREADRIGFGVMTQAGYAPQGAAAMFEKLQYASRLNDNGSYPYLRSHPLTGERIADMQARTPFDPGVPVTLPLRMDHAMVSARARVMVGPGSDLLRQWVQAANGSEYAASAVPKQAAILYAAALSADRLRDFKAAREATARLQKVAAGDPAGARLARLLASEIELDAGAASAALALLDVKARDRTEMLMVAETALAARQPPAQLALLSGQLSDWVAGHPRDATAWRQLAALYAAQGEALRSLRAEAESNVAILDYAGARDRFKAAQDLSRSGAAKGQADFYEASIIDTRAREVDAKLRELQAEREKE